MQILFTSPESLAKIPNAQVIAIDRKADSEYPLPSLHYTRYFMPERSADIIIIAETCGQDRLSRPLLYIDYFADIGLGVDLLVYTEDEASQNSRFINSARERGKMLFKR